MKLKDNINSSKYNLIFYIIILFFIFRLYAKDINIENMTNTNKLDAIKSQMRMIYIADIDAIRNMASIAVQLKTISEFKFISSINVNTSNKINFHHDSKDAKNSISTITVNNNFKRVRITGDKSIDLLLDGNNTTPIATFNTSGLSIQNLSVSETSTINTFNGNINLLSTTNNAKSEKSFLTLNFKKQDNKPTLSLYNCEEPLFRINSEGSFSVNRIQIGSHILTNELIKGVLKINAYYNGYNRFSLTNRKYNRIAGYASKSYLGYTGNIRAKIFGDNKGDHPVFTIDDWDVNKPIPDKITICPGWRIDLFADDKQKEYIAGIHNSRLGDYEADMNTVGKNNKRYKEAKSYNAYWAGINDLN